MRPMGASAVVDARKPVVRIRGTAYPVLLPTLRDPRLHRRIATVEALVVRFPDDRTVRRENVASNQVVTVG